MKDMVTELLTIWDLKRSAAKSAAITQASVRIVFLNIVMIVLNIKAKYGG